MKEGAKIVEAPLVELELRQHRLLGRLPLWEVRVVSIRSNKLSDAELAVARTISGHKETFEVDVPDEVKP